MDFSSFRMALASHSSYPLWPPDIFWSILWKEKILIADRENHTFILISLLFYFRQKQTLRTEGKEVRYRFFQQTWKRKMTLKSPFKCNLILGENVKGHKVIADNTVKIPIPTITLCSIKQLLGTPFILITVCAPYRSRIYFK